MRTATSLVRNGVAEKGLVSSNGHCPAKACKTSQSSFLIQRQCLKKLAVSASVPCGLKCLLNNAFSASNRAAGRTFSSATTPAKASAVLLSVACFAAFNWSEQSAYRASTQMNHFPLEPAPTWMTACFMVSLFTALAPAPLCSGSCSSRERRRHRAHTPVSWASCRCSAGCCTEPPCRDRPACCQWSDNSAPRRMH